jgi:hypothetical protein
MFLHLELEALLEINVSALIGIGCSHRDVESEIEFDVVRKN